MSARDQDEFPQASRSSTAELMVLGGNLVVTATVLSLLLYLGTPVETVATADLVVEAAGIVVAFGIFTGALLVRALANHLPILLLGLFIFQLGGVLDLADGVVRFEAPYWPVLNEVLAVVGELLVVVAMFRYFASSIRMINTDPLTRLHNRRFHMERLAELLRSAGRGRAPMAVVALDLDHFKAVNDVHGHAAGDEALRHTAELLRRVSRTEDLVSRVGGEEFELLLPQVTTTVALEVAERLRERLEAEPPPGLPRLTASLGVAVSAPGDTPDSIRERADRAVYASKQAGRNRVTLAPSPDHPGASAAVAVERMTG